ncbi:hypothetical protein ADICYQ_2441 [Cyclobacterium qasimii M12-11B]|uniref:Uncharacterized protein n=1 Tax=Cyclobacterium qasimii M12-11B TaxID=641524 RepID=S7WXB6_9BACT|nr:hypothetical protein ADICYQ_2441 [Cyclobacterium qasimii M12-11B]
MIHIKGDKNIKVVVQIVNSKFSDDYKSYFEAGISLIKNHEKRNSLAN